MGVDRRPGMGGLTSREPSPPIMSCFGHPHGQRGFAGSLIKVYLDAASKETLANRSFHYDARFTLAPGRYRLRFLVRENQSGK
jgi:hypothetical protein